MLPFGVIDTEILISADSSDDLEQFQVPKKLILFTEKLIYDS